MGMIKSFIQKISTFGHQKQWTQQEQRPHRTTSIVANDMANFSLDIDEDVQLSNADQREYLEVYQTLHWIFCCVKTIADSAALLPKRILNVPTGDYLPTHALLQTFRNPNNLLTRFELFSKTISYFTLVGNAYWFLERGKLDDGIVKLHVPRPDRVNCEPADTSGYKIYNRSRSTGDVEKWNMKDVVHFSSFNPLSDFQGFGQAQAAQQSSILELYQITFGKRFFQNAVLPSLIFKVPEFLSQESYERMMVELKRLHVGVDKFFNVALLEGDAEPIDIKRTSPEDANFQDMKKMSREEIFTTMGCFHLVALLNGESKSSILAAYRLFYELTMMPLLTCFADTINKELLSQYENGDKLEFDFDLRQAPGLRENILEQSQADYRYWMTGIKTVNEIRKERGFGPPLQWGDAPPPTMGISRTDYTAPAQKELEEQQFSHPERYELFRIAEERLRRSRSA